MLPTMWARSVNGSKHKTDFNRIIHPQKLFLENHMFQRQRKEMSPKVKYRRWSVLKRQIQFNKVHGGRIYILLLQKCGHNDRLHRIALIPPFPMSAVWWMWSQTLTRRPVVGLLDGGGMSRKIIF